MVDQMLLIGADSYVAAIWQQSSRYYAVNGYDDVFWVVGDRL